MATPIGFEPTIFAVTGRHVNRYTTGPRICYSISICISVRLVKGKAHYMHSSFLQYSIICDKNL